MSERLSRQDWIDAGLAMLAGSGVDGVRVERLAKALEVTKGSFYWHFKDRHALLQAVLDAWRARATSDVAELEAQRGDARASLRLFKTALQSDAGLDRGVRAWAAKDRMALTALRRVDRRRLVYLRSLFRRLGFGPVEATAWAWFVYQALIGESSLDAHARRRERIAERLEIVYDMLVRKR